MHVHVDDHEAAVAAAHLAGTPREVRVTHLPTGDVVRGAPAAAPALVRAPAGGRGAAVVAVVACAAGPGLHALFTEAGAVAVDGGPGARASTEELLAAVRSTGSVAVVLLPNDTDTIAVARAAATAAAGEGVQVEVVATRAQVQGLAALAVHEPTLDLATCTERMAAAAVEIIRAARKLWRVIGEPFGQSWTRPEGREGRPSGTTSLHRRSPAFTERASSARTNSLKAEPIASGRSAFSVRKLAGPASSRRAAARDTSPGRPASSPNTAATSAAEDQLRRRAGLRRDGAAALRSPSAGGPRPARTS